MDASIQSQAPDWGPWVLLIILVLVAGMIACLLILRPSSQGNKLLPNVITGLITLLGAAGGYAFRGQDVRKIESFSETAKLRNSLKEARDGLDAFENALGQDDGASMGSTRGTDSLTPP